MKEWLVYEDSTQTVRQYPQNYMIAHKRKGAWVCDPDPACNHDLALLVFMLILGNHHLKWGSGTTLMEALVNEMDKR